MYSGDPAIRPRVGQDLGQLAETSTSIAGVRTARHPDPRGKVCASRPLRMAQTFLAESLDRLTEII